MPQRFKVNSLDELEVYVKKYNGKANLYIEIYKDGDIDKIFFDFDGVEKLTSVMKMHKYCLENDLKHCVLFSGRGYHIYIKVNAKGVSNKKMALGNTHVMLAKQIGLTIGDPKKADIDGHIKGNIAQVARIPFTVNIRTDGRRCVYLSESLLNAGINDIIDYSKGNEKGVWFFGNKELDLCEYDTPNEMIFDLVPVEVDKTKDVKELFPLCIKNMLRNSELRYRDRMQLILYLRRIGYKPGEVYQLLKKYLSAEKFEHCSRDEHQVEFLFKTQEYFFMHREIEGRYCFEKNCEASRLYKTWGDINGNTREM